ncbi:MAG: SDR family oxidoreductase [Pseudonocardiaceae bacterium]
MNARTVLITGGSSGIGAETARRLLVDGYQIAVTGRSKDKLATFLDDVGRPDELLGITADAADWESTQAAVASTVERFGQLNAVVANAGFTSADTITDGDPDLWRVMVLTNVLGPALLAKAALPHLQATSGRLLLVGSVAGFKNAPGNLYSATKWAVTGLAENIRMQMTSLGVGVTLIAPGMTETPFWRDGSAPPITLSATAVAETIHFALSQPPGVDINTLVVRPIGQSI